MASSPPSSDPAYARNTGAERDVDLVRYGRRKNTLEYACAAARLGGLRDASEPVTKRRRVMSMPPEPERIDVEDVPVLDWEDDVGGDTEPEEGAHEVATPKSGSFGMESRPRVQPWDVESEIDPAKRKTVSAAEVVEEERAMVVVKEDKEVQHPGKDTTVLDRDADMMDIAHILCGLSGRCEL